MGEDRVLQPEHSSDNKSAWFGPSQVGALVLLLTALRIYVGRQAGLSHDEAYYTFWSTSLAPGYLDHPPMVALLIAGGRALFGNNELGARFLTELCLLATSAAVWRIGSLLFTRGTALLAVLLFNLVPAQIGFVVTPDAPSVLFWTASLWAVAEVMASRQPLWWLAVGAFVGLGLQTKYTVAFLPPGLLLFLLVDRERRKWLTAWQVWAGVAVAVIVFSPQLLWNAQHEWMSFRFQGARTVVPGIDPAFLTHFVELFGGFVISIGPVLAPLALGGIVAGTLLRNQPYLRRFDLLVWTSWPALAYFLFHSLHGGVQPNWPLPLSTTLVLIASWLLIELWRRVRWAAGALVGLQLAIGTTAIAIITAQVLWQPFDLGNSDRSNEMRGWREVAAQIVEVAEENGATWIATGGDYAFTGEIGSYTLFAGSPLSVRQISEPLRWLFLPRLSESAMRERAIFVAQSETPPGAFLNAKLVGSVERRDSRRVIARYWLFLVSGPKAETMAALQ